tara:strand:- start:140 stop:412 length:273 start_codon:yes stop_codon:yes gene_type:complete
MRNVSKNDENLHPLRVTHIFERNQMPGIVVKPEEPLEKILRYFKKQVEKAGIIGDLKKREHHEKPSIRLKKKSLAARKRRIKQMRKLGLL